MYENYGKPIVNRFLFHNNMLLNIEYDLAIQMEISNL